MEARRSSQMDWTGDREEAGCQNAGLSYKEIRFVKQGKWLEHISSIHITSISREPVW